MAPHVHDRGPSRVGSRLQVAFLLTCVILVVELAGGLISNSLALLSDAGHVLTDVFALGLAWFATMQAERPANAERTYGYHRIGILAALANATALIIIVGIIAFEAIRRFQNPQEVTPLVMFISAGVGIGVNLLIASSLHGEGAENLNLRAAMLHVLGDIGASVGVVIAGIVIVLFRWYPIDPILSIAIAVLIARGAWDILRETLDILLEATPRGLNVAHMVRDMVRQPGIEDVHDLHVWSIDGGMSALSAHVQVNDRPLSQCDSLLGSLSRMLHERYRIDHSTIQLECAGCATTHLYCDMRSSGSKRQQHVLRPKEPRQDSA